MKQEKTFNAEKYIRQLIKRTRQGEIAWQATSWTTTADGQDGAHMHTVHGYRAIDKDRRLDICLDPAGSKNYRLSVSVDKIEDAVQLDTAQGWQSMGLVGSVATDLYNAIVDVTFADLTEGIDDTVLEEINSEEGETPYKDRPNITTQQLRRALWFILTCTFVLGVLCGHFLWR